MQHSDPEEPLSPLPHDSAGFLRSLSALEWDEVINDLVAYGWRVARRKHWNTPSGFPEAKTVDDLAMEVLAGLFEEPPTVKWDLAKDKRAGRGKLERLKWFLRFVLRRRVAKFNELLEDELRDPDLQRDGGPSILDQTPNGSDSPEESLVSSIDASRLEDEMRQHLHGHPGRDLFELMVVECPPGQIAEDLGLTEQRVYGLLRNVRECLRRKFRKERVRLRRMVSVAAARREPEEVPSA